MVLSLKKLLIYNTALYAFFALNPFLRWVVGGDIIYIVFLLTTLLLFAVQINRRVYLSTDKHKEILFFILLLYVAYITLPIINNHILRVGHLLWFVPIFIIIFYESFIQKKAYIKLINIIYYLTIYAIIVWILNIVGFNVPYYEIEREGSNMTYRLYGLSVSLYREGFPIQSGLGGIERINGPFSEPGHFAIILGIILLLNNFNLRNRREKIFLLAGVLTFSLFFYFVLCLGIFFKSINEKRITRSNALIIGSILILVAVGSTNTYLGNQIRYIVYERQLSDIEQDPITDRVNPEFFIYYQEFQRSNNTSTGLGYESINLIHTPSNYRVFIYQFGYIGLVLCILSILVLTFKFKKNIIIVALITLIVVLAHRYWMLQLPSIYILIILSIYGNNYKIDEKNNKHVISLKPM